MQIAVIQHAPICRFLDRVKVTSVTGKIAYIELVVMHGIMFSLVVWKAAYSYPESGGFFIWRFPS